MGLHRSTLPTRGSNSKKGVILLDFQNYHHCIVCATIPLQFTLSVRPFICMYMCMTEMTLNCLSVYRSFEHLASQLIFFPEISFLRNICPLLFPFSSWYTAHGRVESKVQGAMSQKLLDVKQTIAPRAIGKEKFNGCFSLKKQFFHFS